MEILFVIYQPNGNPSKIQNTGTPIPAPKHTTSKNMYKITEILVFSLIILSIAFLQNHKDRTALTSFLSKLSSLALYLLQSAKIRKSLAFKEESRS